MIFWLRFAIRSCIRRRKRTGILLLGIACAVASLVVLGAIMVGVNDTMVRNAVAMHGGHITVTGSPGPMQEARVQIEAWGDTLRKIPTAQHILPRISFPAIMKSDINASAIHLRGIDPEAERDVTPIAKNLIQGTYLAAPDGFLIGSAAAEEHHVSVGDEVLFTTSTAQYKRVISGIFHTGVDFYDRSMGFLPQAALAVWEEPQVSYEVAIFTAPHENLKDFALTLSGSAKNGETILSWKELLPEVAQLVELNSFSMSIMIFLVVLILGFGVANALLISVMDRYRHFAVLKAIGTRPSAIAQIIVYEAILMCFTASFIGTLLGIACAVAWGRIGLDLSSYTSYNPHFSADPMVYPRITFYMTFMPQALALCVGILSSLWPAAIAARRSVSQGMRDL